MRCIIVVGRGSSGEVNNGFPAFRSVIAFVELQWKNGMTGFDSHLYITTDHSIRG